MTQLTSRSEDVLALDAAAERPSLRVMLANLGQLTKPRITLLVVATAYIGFAIGLKTVGFVGPLGLLGWLMLALTLLGTALSCMGASALNQVLERDVDALMKRTADRPLPAGRISLPAALTLGVGLSTLGIMILMAVTNPLTAGLAAFTIISYTFIYTPMKRVTSVCTIVGAVPGAMPPVMGFAAATGRLGVEAWIMFAILFLWQLPHFLAIAWLYKDDYAAAGMPMLPVVDVDCRATSRQILLGCLALLPLGLMPTLIGMSGMIYFVGALLGGLMFLGFGIGFVVGGTRRHARALFFASLVYLPLVFALMVIDQV